VHPIQAWLSQGPAFAKPVLLLPLREYVNLQNLVLRQPECGEETFISDSIHGTSHHKMKKKKSTLLKDKKRVKMTWKQITQLIEANGYSGKGVYPMCQSDWT
jgi:hypothetical protein